MTHALLICQFILLSDHHDDDGGNDDDKCSDYDDDLDDADGEANMRNCK